MRSHTAVALGCLVAMACTRPAPLDPVTPDPVSKPLPDAAPPPSPPAPPAALDHNACEPIVSCGFWSKCVWLEQIDATHYRGKGGPEKGKIFVRRRDCSPADAGDAYCAMFCRGADGGPPCIDGLHPENEACTESMPPRPHATHCNLMDGVCGSLI